MTRPYSPFNVAACGLAVSLLISACGGGETTGPADTVAPTVVITDSEAGATATGAVTFTFTFSEDVGTSFTAEDLVVSGGTAGTFTKVDAMHYTLVVTPTATTAGTISVSVAAAKFKDIALNDNTAGADSQQAYDTRPAETGTVLASFDESTALAFLGFNGAEGTTVETGPTGGAGKAIKILRSGGDPWAGAVVTTGAIAFADNRRTITARVYSPTAGIPVKIKVEVPDGSAASAEAGATTAVVAGWQTLTWVVTGLDASKTYTRVVMLPNLATVDAAPGKAYYFDDIKLAAATAVVTPPVGSNGVLASFDEATALVFLGFNGAEGTTVEAGPTGGSGKAIKILRSGGDPWAGAIVTTGAIPLTTDRKTITARVYSPTAGIPMVLKLEDANGAASAETPASSLVMVGWQTLSWVFNGLDASKSYSKIVLLPKLGTVDAAPGVSYYFDDITLPAATGTSGAMSYIAQPFIENVQSAYDTTTSKARTGNYTTGYYAAPGMTWWWGGAFKNKIQGGYGVSKTDVAQSYFGMYIANGGAGWDISAATKYTFSIGTNGECAGKCSANVRLVSAANSACVADVKVLLTAAAQKPYSKNLSEFTVSGCTTNTMAAFKATKVSELHFQMLRADMQFTATTDAGGLYPNGLDMGDSIGFDAPTGAPATAADPVITGPLFSQITFDDTAVTYIGTAFEGASSSIVTGPLTGDTKALKVNKLAGAAPWAGVTISTKANSAIDKIPFTATAKKLTLKVWAPAAGMKIRMKVEDATDVTHNCETDAATTVANGWQTLTFDFSTRAFNNGDPTQLTSNRCVDTALLLVSVMNKVSVFPNFGTEGAVTGDFYFDDLKFVP